MDEHLFWAEELKKGYPEETEGFTIEQIVPIWEEYSDGFSAGWMNPSCKEEVRQVFEEYKKKHMQCPHCGEWASKEK